MNPNFDLWLEEPYMDEETFWEFPDFDDRDPQERLADEEDYLADLYSEGYFDEFPAPE